MSAPIWTEIVDSRPWRGIAAVFTPAHLLSKRVDAMKFAIAIDAPTDPNDAPRWFEVLTLGAARRKRAKPAMQMDGGSVMKASTGDQT